jgi:hypothetical protein
MLHNGPMRETEFSAWIKGDYKTTSGEFMDPSAHASRISNCRRIEKHLGDLDEAYDRDRMESLLNLLEFSKSDAGPRHTIPIEGDAYTGTSTLRAAANLYRKFRDATSSAQSASPVTNPSPEFSKLDAQIRAALPDETRRMQAARFMAELIERAAAKIPAGWVVSWRRDRGGLFLTAAFYRLFSFDKKAIFVAFTTSEARTRMNELVDESEVHLGGSGGFASLDDTTAGYLTHEVFFEHREELEALILRLLDRICGIHQTTSYSRYHSPLAIEWLSAMTGVPLPAPTYAVANRATKRTDALSKLAQEFLATFCASDEGRAHLESYGKSRETARKNLEAIRAAKAAGKDITSLVLTGVLPHADSENNRARGAWTSIAASLAGDVRTKYARYVPEDRWPDVAARILSFIEAAIAEPENIDGVCASFAAAPESLCFQSGMLSPFLNALDPVHFPIVNKKSRLTTNYLTDAGIDQTIATYGTASVVVRETAAEFAELIDSPPVKGVSAGDLYDAFCHWLVAEREFFHEQDAEDVLFEPRAFELLSLLDENPTNKVYQERKAEFRKKIEKPFQRLFPAILERLTPEMRQVLETEKNLFSRFPKNDYGKGGAWPFYWGAFYPKGTQRVNGVQLFVAARSTRLTFGFYIGDLDLPPARRVIASLRDPDATPDGLEQVLDRYVFGEGSEPAALFHSLEDVRAHGSDRDLLDIRQLLPPDEVSTRSLDELADDIAASFRELFPLVQIALGADQTPAVPQAPMRIADAAAPPPTEAFTTAPEYTLEELSIDSGFHKDALRTWVRAIERKGQAIFYGPPGTGKTFVAERLARHLIGGGDGFMETLQFHPAYSYEDFMEGIRPQSSGGALSYPVVPGRFLAFCARAAQRTGRCVLILDEINRANLARVMGELMYLLEYRDQHVPLASGTLFSIPPNVRIIGTMNTADRSIALVDHALRRRFAFIPLRPDYAVLRRYHKDSPLAGSLIKVLTEINSAIEPHYQIGISFFLVPDLAQHLPDVWRMEIEPYLEEYFFDREDKWKQASWEQIAPRLHLGEPVPLDPSPASDKPLQESDD